MINNRLVNYIQQRDKLSPWVLQQRWYDWCRQIDDELNEAAEAITIGDTEHIASELGDVLILVFSMIARYSSFQRVFDAAYRKLRARAPYVLAKKPVTLEQELKYWIDGKAKGK